jgi:hypothetical protein
VRGAKIGPLRRNLLSFSVDEQYRHGAGMEYRLKLLMARVVNICKQSSRHLVDPLLLAANLLWKLHQIGQHRGLMRCENVQNY